MSFAKSLTSITGLSLKRLFDGRDLAIVYKGFMAPQICRQALDNLNLKSFAAGDLRTAFRGYCDSDERLRECLVSAWAHGADLARVGDGKMKSLNIQVLTSQKRIEPTEHGIGIYNNPIKGLSGVLVADLYLKGPTSGGAVELYEENHVEALAAGGVFPSLKIQPETGDLLIYSAHKLKGIQACADKTRVIASCFIGMMGNHLPLLIWGDRA